MTAVFCSGVSVSRNAWAAFAIAAVWPALSCMVTAPSVAMPNAKTMIGMKRAAAFMGPLL